MRKNHLCNRRNHRELRRRSSPLNKQKQLKPLSNEPGGAFGSNRGARPVPPEKGVLPLDHMHQCDLEKKDYLRCLKSSGHQSEKCRLFSKMYLEMSYGKKFNGKTRLE